jgi:DNA-binding transcriptional MocR family regulator
MTLKRREELVTLAREYDALIITDDVYGMCFDICPLCDSD